MKQYDNTKVSAEKTGENGYATPGRTNLNKGLSPEETIRLIIEKSPWEPLEPFVADPNQKLPLVLPEWFDAELFADGQKYYQRNVFSMLGAKLAGLVALLRIKTVTRVLYGTERSATSRKALKRYADTLKEMDIWYVQDPAVEGSWAESLVDIRRRHARAAIASRILQDEDGMKEPPISQFDLAMTQFAFCGMALLRPNELGLEPTQRDIRGFIHFWRLIGYLIGISDRYNLCNEDSDPENCLRLLDLVRAKVFFPLLKQPHTKVSGLLTKSLIEGMWCIVPLLEVESFEHLTKELFADLGDEASKPRMEDLSPTAKYIRYLFHWIIWSLHVPIVGSWFRKYHNNSIRFGMYMIQNYPLLAWWSFGFSYRASTG